MKVFYGLTNHSQLKPGRLPADINILVSARFLMPLPERSPVFDYLQGFGELFLDSGAFGSAFWDGGYTYSCANYLNLVEHVQPDWWATMDYPCEPHIRYGGYPSGVMPIEAKLRLTVENTAYLAESGIGGFVPVIQGWEIADYLHCVDLLERANLLRPVMGVGSICRRGSQANVVAILRALRARLPDVRFHAFGAKLATCTYANGEALNYLHSLDTAAWQYKRQADGKKVTLKVNTFPAQFRAYRAKLERLLAGPYQGLLEPATVEELT